MFSWEASADRLWQFARDTVAARSHWVARTNGKTNGAFTSTSTSASTIEVTGDDPRWAILATVVYADLFDAPISVDEVARTCLGARLSPAEVRARLTTPPLSDLVTVDPTDAVTLRGREELVARREDGIRRTAELLERHHRVIGALANLPFVRMLALSGGTAHRNARGGDDIDLFVVATAGRAYTAYTMLFLASYLTRRRGIVCPNYLVDENHLRIAYHHDLFTAHQAISLVPIAGLPTFDAFVRANEVWVREFYPAYRPRPPGATLATSPLQRVAEGVLRWSLGDEVERLLSVGWRFHLGRRAASAPRPDLVLDPGILKLHLSDHRRRVLDKFADRLQRPQGAMAPGGSEAMTRALGPAAVVVAALAVPLFYIPGFESPFADPKLALLLVAGGVGLAAWLLSRPGGAEPAMAGGGRADSGSLRAAVAALVVTMLLAAAVAAFRRPPGAPYAIAEIVRLAAMLGVAAGAAQVARDPVWRRRLFEAIHVSAGVVSLIGLLQHLEVLPFALPVISTPGSTFGNRNMAGEAIALAIPFGFATVGLRGARQAAFRRRRCPPDLRELLYLAVTRARGAWIGGAAGIVVFLAVRRPALPRAAHLLALPVAAAVLAAALLPGRWRSRDANDTKRYEPGARVVLEALDPASSVARTRLGLWRRTLAMYREHPLFGVGPGNFPVVFPRYAEPSAAADGVMSAT